MYALFRAKFNSTQSVKQANSCSLYKNSQWPLYLRDKGHWEYSEHFYLGEKGHQECAKGHWELTKGHQECAKGHRELTKGHWGFV